jgi:hypothetical protein
MDYVYVKSSHRIFDPQNVNYMNMSKYLRMMLETNGLEYDPMAPFIVPSNYSPFRIIDKGKAMLFCLNNGEWISKPE